MTRRTRTLAALVAAWLVVVAGGASACSRREPPKVYSITGQVLAVHEDRQQLTVRHDDIPDFMPGMTMSFPVASPGLLTGREPGELIKATLEVTDSVGRLTAIERVGFTPLPTDTNAAAMAAGILQAGDDAPDAAFIDQQNQRRAVFSDWKGSVTLATFIYTRCPLPNFCPLMDKHFAALQRTIAAEPELRASVRLVSISFDPEYDTPEVLAKHAAGLKADPALWTFVTGDRVTVDRFAAKLGVGLVRTADSTEITHNLRTVLVGRNGKISQIYSGSEWTPAKVLEDIRSALRQP
jgi:protein SCO1/2